jgi:hypothetical protein
MFESATPGSPHNSCPVRIIHKHCRLVLFSQGSNVGQRRDIPIHAEKTIRHNEGWPGWRSAVEQSFQMIHVPMVIHPKRGAAQSAAIDEASVTQSIRENQASLADKGWNDADIE